MKKLYAFILFLIASAITHAQIVEISNNPGSSASIVVGQSNYHVSESIYLDSEMGSTNFLTSGTSVTKIAFSLNSNTSVALPRTLNNFKISMKNTTTTTLVGGANNTTGYTVVYNGAITFSSIGWKVINLSTPFVRLTGQNLQVKIERLDNIANSSLVFDAAMGNSVSATATSSRRYNGTATVTTTTNLTATFFRPAIQLIRPFPVDAQATSIVNPVNSCFNTAQTLKVAVKNNGTTAIAAGAVSVNLSITGANTSITTSSNTSVIPVDSTALVVFNGIDLSNAGTNNETAIVNIASDGFRGNDTTTSSVTTATVLSALPQFEDVEGQFNVFSYLKAVTGANAWTVLSFISNTGAFNNGWNLDSLTTRPNGTGADFFIFDSYDAAPGTVSRLYSNCISLPATGASRVSFWMSHDSAFATNLDSLYLSVSNNKGVTWTRIKGFKRSDASLIEYAWIQDSVDISAYNGQTIQLAFEGVSAFGNAFGLDDINVYNVAAICLPTNNTSVVSSCNSYTWGANNNTVYNTSGTYLRNYVNACGANSVDTLKLTINPSTYTSVTRSSCVSYTWPVNGQTYSSSGTYIRRYINTNGCSSADTLKLTIYQGSFTSTTVNSCRTYLWSANGQTYSTSGTYTRIYTNVNGCTSVDTLKLTINQGTYTSVSVTSCGSYTWLANGQTYNASGVYVRNYNNSNGCSSADTLKLTINQGTYTSTSVNNCGTYTWLANGQTYNASGVYVHNYNNVNGCASADTLKLTLNQGTYTSNIVTNCGSYTWSVNGQTYNASGTYIRTYTNVNGCPSADTLKLTINQSTYTSTSVSNCGNYTWSANGTTYTTSGTYIRTYTNLNGCLSADTLKLTIKQGTYTTTNVVRCGSYIWPVNGTTYTNSGTYIRTFTNVNGCPSVDTLKLTINQGTYTTTIITNCGNYTWPVNGTTYTNSGTYTRTYTNSDGCPSADTLKLTINQGTYTSNSVSNCGNYTWSVNGTTYTTSGTYIRTYTNSDGCLSADTLKLTIKQGTYTSTSVTNCSSYTWNGTTYSTSGTYTKNYLNGNGCPSVDTLKLTINQGTYSSTSITNCSSYTWNGTTYSTSGIYTKNYLNGNGCPSVDTLKLTINQGTNSSTSVTNCSSYTWNGSTYSTSGSYTKNYLNGNGCSSVDTLKLTINQGTYTSTSVSNCGPYTWNGVTYSTSGMYTKNYINGNGCPSVDTLNLTINHGDFSLVSVVKCGDYTWSANGQTYNTSGIYTHIYTNTLGCPSADTLNLTITPQINNSITISSCQSYYWTTNGNIYTTSGIYTYNNINCGTTDTLKLTINQGSYTSNRVINCESYTWNGTTYTSSGTYTRNYINGNGCPSVDTLHLTINVGNYNSTNVTNCGSYTWNGTTYTTSGTYIKNYSNGNGCSSVDTLHLTINEGTYTSMNVINCDSYLWNGITYTSSGNYTKSYLNANGCPSVDTLQLTITGGTYTSNSVTNCGPYTWNGITFTSTGTYTKNYLNANGCQSVDTLKLTINQGTYTSTSVSSCNSYFWNGTTYTISGTYTKTYTNVNGCTSSDTLKLTINQETYTSTSITNCGPYIWNGTTYTSSGTYTKNYLNVNGCNAVDTMILIINQATHTTTSTTACESYTWLANGQTYSNSGTYVRNYFNANGCASADTLKLTINQGSYTSTSVSSCGSYTWSKNNQTYTLSGIYTQAYTNVYGCLSVDTLKLTINQGSYSSANETHCNSYTWPLNNQTYNATGTYIRTYLNANGCPSADTLKLTINQGTYTSISVTNCGPYTWTANNQIYSVSGNYVRNYNNLNGCPSADTLKLSINQGTYTSTTMASCGSYTWPANNQNYNASGVYIRTFTNANGCPSADTLKLTINQATYTSVAVTTCESYVWPVNNITYNQSGIYVRNYTNTQGCLSTDTLKLTITNGTFTSTTITSCSSYIWPVNNQTYTTSGIYVNIYSNNSGCFSADTLKLTINESSYSSTSVTTCESYTWPINGMVYDTTGTYVRNYINSNGCPSADTLKLWINHATNNAFKIASCDEYVWYGTTYTESGSYTRNYINGLGCVSTDTLYLKINTHSDSTISVSTSSEYNWLLSGETYFESGEYYYTIAEPDRCVIVRLNLIITTAKIYPNPTTGIIKINLSSIDIPENTPVTFSVFDRIGRLVKKEKVFSRVINEIDLTPFSNGIYVLKVETIDKVYFTTKILKQGAN